MLNLALASPKWEFSNPQISILRKMMERNAFNASFYHAQIFKKIHGLKQLHGRSFSGWVLNTLARIDRCKCTHCNYSNDGPETSKFVHPLPLLSKGRFTLLLIVYVFQQDFLGCVPNFYKSV